MMLAGANVAQTGCSLDSGREKRHQRSPNHFCFEHPGERLLAEGRRTWYNLPARTGWHGDPARLGAYPKNV